MHHQGWKEATKGKRKSLHRELPDTHDNLHWEHLFYIKKALFSPRRIARLESDPETYPRLILERDFDLKLSESSDQSNSERKGVWGARWWEELLSAALEASRVQGPLRSCQRARERNWGEHVLWLCLFPVSARLLCKKKDRTEKGNAKGAQCHGLRAGPFRDQSGDLPRRWDAFLSCLGWSLGPQVTEEEEAAVSRLGPSDPGVGQKTRCRARFPGLKGDTLEQMVSFKSVGGWVTGQVSYVGLQRHGSHPSLLHPID